MITNLVPTQRRFDPLAPVAYSEDDFPALRLTRASRWSRMLARILFVALVVGTAAMFFAPWQQSVTGSGNVVAFAPLDRRQMVEAPINGRIVALGENIRENAKVEKGQMILEMQDIDPLALQRLQMQLEASERQLEAQQSQLSAMQRQLAASKTIVESYDAQARAFVEVKEQTVAAAEEYIDMAESKLAAAKQNMDAVRATEAQAAADFERKRQLFTEGLASELQMQLAEQKFKEAASKVEQANSYVEAAKSEVRAKQRERDAKEREVQAKIESTQAILRKARGDVAKSESELAKAESEVNKIQKELIDLQGKISKQQSQVVRAPRDGFVMRLTAYQDGQYIKAGDPLFELVPDTDRPAVQIWVDGNDAPLISPGREVRLQFEGWPAVQFAGWPSVAVGTFGGRVGLIDATDDGAGKFRVIVVPDESAGPWPEKRYLRQGVRANGWVLLNQVPLGYEIWRRMNGFPPSVQSKQSKEKAEKGVPKLKA